jgi:4-cresol dehydrogenase (hydroxylating)
LVHLQYLDKILDYDPELGTVLIEPGVSQGQLFSFLESQNSDWVLDVTGSDKNASVVGNYLERGFGHTSHGDHESYSKALEVLTPDGKLFCPDLMSSGDSKIKGLYQHDLALNLEKLFYQTHFGIVTKLLIRLKPKNQRTCFCAVIVKSDEEVAEVLKKIGHLKASGVLSAVPHIANVGRLQKTTESKVNLGAAWIATIDLSGRKEIVAARIKVLKKTLRGHRVVPFNDTQIKWLQRIARLIPPWFAVKNQLENLHLIKSLLAGKPVDEFVNRALYSDSGMRKRMSWLCPVFPLSHGHFQKVKSIVAEEFQSHGFNFSATLSLISDKCCVMIAEISVEQESSDRLISADQCYRRCHDRLLEAGYPFYRYGLRNGLLVHSWMAKNPEYLKVYEVLKKHFDPHGVLSAGRWGI